MFRGLNYPFVWVFAGVLALSLNGGMPALHSETTDNTTVGKDLYLVNCAACHNDSRRIGHPLAKGMSYFVQAGVPVSLLAGMLTQTVRNPPADTKPMPTFAAKDLSDADVANLTAYLYSLTPPPATPPVLGKAENGQWLFSVACSGCHGDQGEGKGRAPALAGMANMFKGMNAPPNTMLGMVMLATRSGYIKMPTFSPEKLKDAQLADIAAYIWSLPPPPSKNAPAQKAKPK